VPPGPSWGPWEELCKPWWAKQGPLLHWTQAAPAVWQYGGLINRTQWWRRGETGKVN